MGRHQMPIHLTQGKGNWQILVITIMKLWVPQNAGNFLTIWGNITFFWRTLIHGVSYEPTCNRLAASSVNYHGVSIHYHYKMTVHVSIKIRYACTLVFKVRKLQLQSFFPVILFVHQLPCTFFTVNYSSFTDKSHSVIYFVHLSTHWSVLLNSQQFSLGCVQQSCPWFVSFTSQHFSYQLYSSDLFCAQIL